MGLGLVGRDGSRDEGSDKTGCKVGRQGMWDSWGMGLQ